jgi:hypothetical protein
MTDVATVPTDAQAAILAAVGLEGGIDELQIEQPPMPSKPRPERKRRDSYGESGSDSEDEDEDSDTEMARREVANWLAREQAKNSRRQKEQQARRNSLRDQVRRQSIDAGEIKEGEKVSEEQPLGRPYGRRASLHSQNTMRPTLQVNLLDMMKSGRPFLILERGRTKFRQVELSDDLQFISIFSKATNKKNRQIFFKDITEIRLGQNTKNFSKFRCEELEHQSFSIHYKKGKKEQVRELVSQDINEFRIWSTGLHKLLEIQQQAGGIDSGMESLFADLVIEAGRRSSVSITDHDTALSADVLAGEVLINKEEIELQTSARSNPTQRRVTQIKFNEVQKGVEKARAKLELPKYLSSTQYNNMLRVVARCDLSLARVKDWLHYGMLQKCNDELWRTQVDLEALNEMLKVVT